MEVEADTSEAEREGRREEARGGETLEGDRQRQAETGRDRPEEARGLR
jgi:hypothetical protein